MNAKEMLIDFLNFIFAIIIVGLTVLYFIAGDNFEGFKNLMQSLAPFGLFGLLLMIAIRLNREKTKKRRSEGNMDVEISMNYIDKMKADFFVFAIPIFVCLVALGMGKTVTLVDFSQAVGAFLIAYLFRWWIFSKEKI